MTSEVFCDGLSGGGEEYRTRGSHLRSRSTMNICNSTMSDIMESGYIKISEPHHLDRLKMLSASVRDGHIWAGVETRAGHENRGRGRLSQLLQFCLKISSKNQVRPVGEEQKKPWDTCRCVPERNSFFRKVGLAFSALL